MGDAIKRLFHRRYRSTDKDFKQPQPQSFPYRNAVPGTPPQRGSSPLHGTLQTAASNPSLRPSLGVTGRQRSASLGTTTTTDPAHPHHLRKTASNASRKGRPHMAPTSKPAHGGRRSMEGTRNAAPPPLPGTAVTSDDARHWSNDESSITADLDNMSLTDRFMPGGFPESPGDVAIRDMLGYHDRAPASSSTESQGDASYSLANGEAVSSLNPVRSNDTQSRLFLDDSSDDEKRPESSGGPGHSPSSLKRKKGHAGLRNFSNPRNDYSVQPTISDDKVRDSKALEHRQKDTSPSYLVHDSAEPPSLEGVVDLRDTEQISYYSRYAPAVTHETIKPEVHHIREERIFREIHTHDVFHRILSIVDVEVLPARHFVPTEDGSLQEIPAEDVPGRNDDAQARNWLIAELVSRKTKNDTTPVGRRQFTARAFHGTDGDEKKYMTEEGYERTETTWVHAPTLETGARETGQTVPLYVQSPDAPAGQYNKAKADDAVQPRSLKDLAGGVRNAPFDECVEFEEQQRKAIA